MSSKTDDFVLKLVDLVPILRPILDEHLADYDDEILSYLFMADVARWAGAQAQIEPALPSTALKLLLGILEEHVDGFGEIANLVAVGFVESLPSTGEPGGKQVRDMLGPLLRLEYQQLNG